MPEVNTRHGLGVYHEYGQEAGSAATLILLHANPGDHHDFDAIIPALATQFRIVAVDWPGYGDSAAPQPPQQASAMMFADVLEDIVNTLPDQRMVFLGNSVGGFAATRLAIGCPERVQALILISSGGFTTVNLISRLFCRLKGNETITRLIVPRFARVYLKMRNEYVRQILQRTDAGARNRTTVAVDAAVWRSFSHPQHDLRSRARQITAPTLIINGQFDPLITAKGDGANAAAAIPGSKQVVSPTGHEPFAEAPDDFLETIMPFLNQHTATSA